MPMLFASSRKSMELRRFFRISKAALRIRYSGAPTVKICRKAAPPWLTRNRKMISRRISGARIGASSGVAKSSTSFT